MCTVHLDYGNLECLYQSAEWNTQIYIENGSNTLYNIYILYNIISTALKRSLIDWQFVCFLIRKMVLMLKTMGKKAFWFWLGIQVKLYLY